MLESIRREAVVLAVATAFFVPKGAHAERSLPVCDWPVVSDANFGNVAFPDEAAWYWVTEIPAIPGTRLRIDGKYPDARYFSFHVYDSLQRPVDGIADCEIEPQAGASNPFTIAGAEFGGSYAVTVELDGKDPACTANLAAPDKCTNPESRTDACGENTLHAGATTLVTELPNPRLSVIYRVYVPGDSEDPAGEWGLPRLALETADGGVELLSFAACGELTSSKGIPAAGGLNEAVKGTGFPDQAAVAPYLFASDDPTFTKFFGLPETARRLAETAVGNLAKIAGQEPDDEIPPSSALTAGGGGGFLSNTHNNYLAAAFSRERGNAYVVRAKAPTAGLAPDDQEDLRYWSFCVNEFASQRFVACSIDEQTLPHVDANGFFTFVVSDPEDRPETLPDDVVWIPWGGAYYDSLVIYRHMLPSVGFGQAIQHVPYWKHSSGGAEDPALGRADPAATMGCYYPRAAYCEADDLAGKVKGQEIFEACFGVGDSANDPFAGC